MFCEGFDEKDKQLNILCASRNLRRTFGKYFIYFIRFFYHIIHFIQSFVPSRSFFPPVMVCSDSDGPYSRTGFYLSDKQQLDAEDFLLGFLPSLP